MNNMHINNVYTETYVNQIANSITGPLDYLVTLLLQTLSLWSPLLLKELPRLNAWPPVMLMETSTVHNG